MKRLLLLLWAAGTSLVASADEGMWLLPYLQKVNIKQMKQHGCKLSAEEIYSINHNSLKDAIIIFGGGCTGEIVSPKGLIFTNHHCGFGSIQQLSSVEHDYLKHGYWAMSEAEELPVPGLQVRFVRRIIDATADILGNVPSIASDEEHNRIVDENIQALKEKLEASYPQKEISIKPFFEGNQYFAFVLEVYTDVRLVGAPPQAIGKFGGNTDNWMWPRHTGDFSIFRVYANAENRPADYSPENRPYQAEEYLKVSTKGVEEGDFAMVMGFPGSTERYATSYEIDHMLSTRLPQRIFIRGERQDILWADMMADPAVRIQYASKYASSSNYWKNAIGMSRGLEKLHVRDRKVEQETSFQAWAEKNTLPEEGYMDALEKVHQGMQEIAQVDAGYLYLNEAIIRSVELFNAVRLAARMIDKDPAEATVWAENWYKDYNVATDRKVAKRMLTIVRENMTELPSFYSEIIDKEYGGDIDAYVDALYDQSAFTTLEGCKAMLAKGSRKAFKNDIAWKFEQSVLVLYSRLSKERIARMGKVTEGRRKYVAGLMMQNPKKAWAPDANFTIRLTYGRVRSYSPADGIRYNHYTSLKGVIEKENPENPAEFTVPDKLKTLYETRDFGKYANAKGELPVCFLADLDITGGNSGSPVLNARGELIGLAFDGNWEAMSGDIAFEPELQRCIAVDVRYLLFIVDKFAGASWLLNELTLVQ